MSSSLQPLLQPRSSVTFLSTFPPLTGAGNLAESFWISLKLSRPSANRQFICSRRFFCIWYANRSLFVFVSVAFSGILVDLVKWVAGRYRPVMLFDQGLYGFTFFRTGYEWTSFASGHAATAFSLAAALSVLYPNGRLFFFPAAIVTAASRIILTSHFLSDVIFGAYIGVAGVYLLKEFFDHKGWMLR
jgi:membrane-associated phospholipid phosphatase